METTIKEADLLLREGQWARVIDLLEHQIASEILTVGENRRCFQAIAVAHVMRYGAEGDWVRVLRLQEEEGSDADVKVKGIVSLVLNPTPLGNLSEVILVSSILISIRHLPPPL